MNEKKFKEMQVLAGAERLERYPLLDMAQNSTIILIGDKAYTIGDEIKREERENARDYVRVEGDSGRVKKTLVEVAELGTLDELAFRRNEIQLAELRETYAIQVWSNLRLESRLGKMDLDTPQVIISKVLPYLRGEQYERKVQDILGAENQPEIEKGEAEIVVVKAENERFAKQLKTITEQILAEINILAEDVRDEILKDEDPERTKKQSKLDKLLDDPRKIEKYVGESLIGRAIGNQNAALINGKLHQLVPTIEEMKDYLSINGRNFEIGAPLSLEPIEDNYRKLVSQKIKLEALAEKFPRERISEALKSKFKGLDELAGLDEYQEGDFGFVKKDDRYFVYVKVPAFALKSSCDNNLYFFKETRVGTFVSANGDSISYDSEMYMIDNNDHPFLHRKKEDFAKICIGYAKMPDSGKDKGDVIAKRLRKTANLLMFGCYSTNYSQAYKLIGENYGSIKTTPEKMAEADIQVIEEKVRWGRD